MRFKRKKVTKYRGSKTHGGGAMKKRRGAGHRGGRGRAGSGKKGDAKKPSYWKEKKIIGFTSKSRKNVKAVNLDVISNYLNIWLEKGFATKKPTGYEIDLKKAGYDKVIGRGTIKQKLIIIANFASKKAVERVKEAGGEIKILQVKKVKIKKTAKPKKAAEPENDSDEAESTPKNTPKKEEKKKEVPPKPTPKAEPQAKA
ncbi:MAG: uL15 family ribosomal protein [Nanoarchaeota archaeon]|nr:uL15 family ribosomal protein [Nanoarchaeota archaeon]MBU1321372.1 uL15 family ribosomal protein [Nanoarchaeota archaeon]MBU1597364.1 uL15 family ribosomal protein [Nanoarchaeota archaeon]MBU2441279.1 uL15 family ribosomal protein [Nanoarchaeota archaeon]